LTQSILSIGVILTLLLRMDGIDSPPVTILESIVPRDGTGHSVQRCGFDKRFRGCFSGLREPSAPFAFN
jgi:hypothetical protein